MEGASNIETALFLGRGQTVSFFMHTHHSSRAPPLLAELAADVYKACASYELLEPEETIVVFHVDSTTGATFPTWVGSVSGPEVEFPQGALDTALVQLIRAPRTRYDGYVCVQVRLTDAGTPAVCEVFVQDEMPQTLLAMFEGFAGANEQPPKLGPLQRVRVLS